MLRVVSEVPVVSPGRRAFPLPFADASLGSKAGSCDQKHVEASSMSMQISDIYICTRWSHFNLCSDRQIDQPTDSKTDARANTDWPNMCYRHDIQYHTMRIDVFVRWIGLGGMGG